MSPAASPTRSARPRASVEPRLAQREPITAQFFELVEGSAVRLAEPPEMGPQARSLLLPAADAEIRVIALREDPAVAARDDAQLEREPPVVRRAIHLRVGHVPLERDADDAVAAELERARAVTPLTPSAPIRTSASMPSTATPSARTSRSPTFTPSRSSAPASTAFCTRKWSSRFRCVM